MRDYTKKLALVIVLAATGLGVSIELEVLHRRLAADAGFASFCNVSAGVNCDAVLSSRQASLAGISVSSFAILYYTLMIALAAGVAAARRATTREFLGNLILLGALCGVMFSLYMAGVAFFVLHTVCLMCSALYLVAIGMFVGAWRLRNALRIGGRRQARGRTGQDRWVVVGGATAAAVLIAVGSWEAVGRSHQLPSATEIQQKRPEFYRWFFAQPVAQLPSDASHALGEANAPVVVVEFSDFECGHCAAFHQSLEDVLRQPGANVRVVFRHFPLDSACNPKVPSRVHPEACLAAVAAECAAEQGRFWPYHNLLFDNQQRLGREYLIGYAKQLELDTARFSTCLTGDAANGRVERDAKDGALLGIDSTPTVFINGRMIKGALDATGLADALVLARGSTPVKN